MDHGRPAHHPPPVVALMSSFRFERSGHNPQFEEATGYTDLMTGTISCRQPTSAPDDRSSYSVAARRVTASMSYRVAFPITTTPTSCDG